MPVTRAGISNHVAAVFVENPMKTKNPPAYWLSCVFMIFGAAAASATTIVLPTDEQLIAKSPLIVEAHVLNTTAVDIDGRIWTEVTGAEGKCQRTHRCP